MTDYTALRETLEDALWRYALDFDKRGEEQAAEWARVPSQVGAYWGLTGGLADLPCTQEGFATFLADAALAAGVRASRRGLMSRFLRIFPSYVRQHHMELLLRERFRSVMRGHDLDHKGFDFLVNEQGLQCGLGLSMETANARSWEPVKAHRNPPPLNVPVLHLHIELNRGLQCGRFTLHTPADLDHFAAWMARQRVRLLGDDGKEAGTG